jgi:hypothetical protein
LPKGEKNNKSRRRRFENGGMLMSDDWISEDWQAVVEEIVADNLHRLCYAIQRITGSGDSGR